MIERESKSGHKVAWNPENESVAAEVLKNNGVSKGDKVDEQTYRSIKSEYANFLTYSLSLNLDDGDIQGGGSGEEKIAVELRDHAGDLVSGEHTAVVEVDGYAYDVSLTDGEGTHSLTTAEPAGSNVEVEAVDVLELGEADETVEPSRTKVVNVV